MEVYGLAFCEVHGPEAKSGALEELYFDATNFLERFDNPHVPPPNPATLAVLAGVLATSWGSDPSSLRAASPSFLSLTSPLSLNEILHTLATAFKPFSRVVPGRCS
jgi:hypothetical protein